MIIITTNESKMRERLFLRVLRQRDLAFSILSELKPTVVFTGSSSFRAIGNLIFKA